jgi:cell division protease FtsH
VSDENKKVDKKPSKKDIFGKMKIDSLKKKPSGPMNTVLIWALIITAIIVALKYIDAAPMNKPVKLEYSQFLSLIEEFEKPLKSADIIQKGGLRATLNGVVFDKSLLQNVVGPEKKVNNSKFEVNLPFVDSEMLEQWDEKGFTYTFDEEKVTFLSILLSGWPVLLLIAFWFFMFRSMSGGQKGMFSFGKSKAKLHDSDNPKNTFDDVAGAQEAKEELEEIIDFLKAPEKYRKLGGKIPKGVLLLGPPGTGKTLLARAVAGEAGVPFFSMSGSDFVEMFVGVGASRVRDLFENAKKSSPSIIFIDEIDAVGRQRGAGVGGGHDEREQTLNQMLVEMDGFESNSGVILIAATNRPDVLDPALLRPGRFDRQVVVDAPDVKGREGILEVHTKDIPLADDVNLNIIAKGTPGFVGADLANLANEAALMAARFDQDSVTMLDFEEARDKVIMGSERKSKVLTEDDKRKVAYHEAGHAICTLNCKTADALHKVTIIPRGRALGITWSLPNEDVLHHTRSYIEDQVCIYMGGRVAEKLIFGEFTNGASGDIQGATQLVRQMICDFGMSDELGPVAYGKKEEQIFLGREIANHRDFSEKTAETIDSLMYDFITQQETRATQILTGKKDELDLLANALIEHELLDKEEIDIILSGEKLESAKKSRKSDKYEIRRTERAKKLAEELAKKEADEKTKNEETEKDKKSSSKDSDDSDKKEQDTEDKGE